MGRPSRKDKPVLPDYAEGIQIRTEDEDPRFSNALARGLAVLRAFQVDVEMLGNLELAEISGLPKSTVSRLTYTLTQLGYLRYREEFGKYELAAGVVGLAYPYLANQPVPPIARPLMVELAGRTKTNVGLGVHEGLSVLYLEYALGEVNPSRRQRAGFRVPLVRTGMGRACIAGMFREDRERLYEDLRGYYAKEWPALQRQLQESIAEFEMNGYCTAAGTFDRSTNSVAVPFVWGERRTVMAFNAQGHSQSLTPQVLARNGRKLVELADEVRKRLAAAPAAPSLGRHELDW